jgi:uncharacterized repeat protein (TIGR03803 family)
MFQRKLRWIAERVTVAMVLAISAWPATEKILYTFTGGNDGAEPSSTLIFDQKGNLYGTTVLGGAHGYGNVFELSPNSDGTWTESVVYSFGAYAGDGANPDDNNGLVFDSGGNLYGTTGGGGNSSTCPFGDQGCGTIFELSPNSGGGWKETILYNFNGGTDGASPGGGVIFDREGNLYGMADIGGNLMACVGGCGTVFKLTPKHRAWSFSVLHAFSESDGGYPSTGLSLDSSGLLWGTTNSGGACGPYACGVVFKLGRDGNGYHVVFNFEVEAQPGRSVPLFGRFKGHIVGTTASAGDSDSGTVFMLLPSPRRGYKLKTMYSFRGGDDGRTPLGTLVQAPSGGLYGTTSVGGGTEQVCNDGGCGTVYELAWQKHAGWRETVLYRFQGGTDGWYPDAGLVMDSGGNLYGTTVWGGMNNEGTVFEITP